MRGFFVINYYMLNSATLLRSPKTTFEGLEMFPEYALLKIEMLFSLGTQYLLKFLVSL